MNLQAILSTQLYRTETAPRYFLGHSFALGYLAANILVTSTQWYVLSRANAEKERRNATAGDSTGKEDSRPFEGDEDVRWRFVL
jgi:hypothetical protein